MAVLKCKACGGSLQIVDLTQTVCDCGSCGRKQLIPILNDVKKAKLYEMADTTYENYEFKKALGIYQSIVNYYPDEVSAYWEMMLCSYGIKYISDSATGRNLPICHIPSEESILENQYYLKAIENADEETAAVLTAEATLLEAARVGMIEQSSRVEPFDIFISHLENDYHGTPTIDGEEAQRAYGYLAKKGYSVYFSRVTLAEKSELEQEIIISAALNTSKVMLVFGTSYENYNSAHVRDEWNRFLALKESNPDKIIIPCYRNIDVFDMPREFAKFDSQNMSDSDAIAALIAKIDAVFKAPEPEVEAAPVAQEVVEAPVEEVAEEAVVPQTKEEARLSMFESYENAEAEQPKTNSDIDNENETEVIEQKQPEPVAEPTREELFAQADSIADEAKLDEEVRALSEESNEELDEEAQKLAKKEEAYQKAIEEFNNAKESEEFETVRDKFFVLKGYKECEFYINECEEAVDKIETAKRQEESKMFEERIRQAKEREAQRKKGKKWQSLKMAFQVMIPFIIIALFFVFMTHR